MYQIDHYAYAMSKVFLGIDVQEKRECCFAALDEEGALLQSGWFRNPMENVVNLVNDLQKSAVVSVGIDAPRQPLPGARRWYWNKKGSRWTERVGQRGYGRHCEVVVSAHGLANPQWTPIKEEAPSWMAIGFAMFTALKNTTSSVYEVFPTASYSLLRGVTDVRISIDFSSCMSGPKDMLDAFVAAATVREFAFGRGSEVGGGDNLGTIILPRPLPKPVVKEVLSWPG